MTSILIAGSGGYVGSFLVKHLSEKFEVIAATRGHQPFSDKAREVIYHDLAQPWRFKINPDIIIFTAAQHKFSRQPPTTDAFLKSNIHALYNALTFAESCTPKLFIYLSTVSVLGDIRERSVTEHSVINNPNFYGSTKFFGEKLVQTFSEKVTAITIRLPGIVGPNLPAGRPWLHTIAKRLQLGEEVEYYNPKSLFNNICDLWTINDFILHLSARPNWPSNNPVNLAASEPIQLFKVIDLMRERLKSSSPITARKTDKTSFTIDTSIVENQYAYLPANTTEMTTRFIDDFLFDFNRR